MNTNTDREISFEINHYRVNPGSIWVAISFVVCPLIVSCGFKLFNSEYYAFVMFFAAAIFSLLIFIGDKFEKALSTISADDEKLTFIKMKHSEVIPYEDIFQFYCKTFDEKSIKITIHRIMLVIITTDGKRHCYSDKLDGGQNIAIMPGEETGGIKMLQMYKFLAERMPGKAKGFLY